VFVFGQDLMEDSVVWSDEEMAICLDNNRPAMRANARVHYNDVDGFFRKPAIRVGDHEGGFHGLEGSHFMAYVDDLRSGAEVQDDAFHHGDEMVLQAEIGSESEYRRHRLINWKQPHVSRFYFDHNATTPVLPSVADEMRSAALEVWGNPSSIHQDGQRARHSVEKARHQVATLLGATAKEIVFTSGGTESNNLAIQGVATAARQHIVASVVEHPSVLQTFSQMERQGVEATYLAVSRDGVVGTEYLSRLVKATTVLMSVMHANNETGAIQPVAEIAEFARSRGIVVHCDGVQAAGRIPVDVASLGVDLYSISGHKLYAPKGCGALYVRKGTVLKPLQYGGRHEQGFRPGTENVPGIVAMGAAAEIAARDVAVESVRVGALRDRLEAGLLASIPDTAVNGPAVRTPNTTNIRFDGIDGEAMVIALDLKGFAVSTGAACSSGAVEPSHVLLAMGLTREQAKSSIRFSLGRSNDEAQVDALIAAAAECAGRLRRLSPTYAHA